MTKGAGTVFATVGTGGETMQGPKTTDPESGYFRAWNGANANPTWGFLDVKADANELTASFFGTSGGTFTDSFTIGAGSVPPVNGSPVAVFSSVVSGLGVSFDGSGSSDPDGRVVSYAWSFGDGSTGVGATPVHQYAVAGQYDVSLTVTDDGGATGVVSHQVSVASEPPPAGSLGFVGAAHSADGAAKFKQVSVPSQASAGDTMLVFLTKSINATASGPVGLTGWTQVGSFVNSSIESTVWRRTVGAGDAGQAVRINYDRYSKGVLNVVVYSGVGSGGLTVAHAGDSRSTTHTSPVVTAAAGDWVLSYWADMSAATTAWTAPGSVTVRDTAVGVGKGRYGLLVADSGGPVSAGSYGGLTATTDATSNHAISWTIALTPTP
jgi:PKD repeat protein